MAIRRTDTMKPDATPAPATSLPAPFQAEMKSLTDSAGLDAWTEQEGDSYDIADPFGLFIKGREILGRRDRRFSGVPVLCAAELLERHASALMLIGRDLESARTSEEIIRRFSHHPDASPHVARAHFNAGCALLRIGLIDRAIDHFNVVANGPASTDGSTDGSTNGFADGSAGDDRLVLLAREGLRQGAAATARMRRHRQRLHGRAGR